MATNNDISIIINAKDNASAVLQSTANTLKKTADSMTSVGKDLTQYVTLPIVGVSTAAIHMAGDFEQSLNILQSVSGATAAQMNKLRQEARDLGNDISLPGVSAADAADAMTELAKAGLSVNDVMAASKGVLSLAKAGQLETADAATTTARALNAFGLAGNQAGTIADLLAAAANASTASVQDMALGLQMAGAQSHQMKVNLQDTVTALSLFSNAGINGSDAGTALKQMFIQLATPTKEAAGLMQQLGLKFFDAKGNFIGLSNMAQLLQDKLKGLTVEQRNSAMATIFGADATRVAAVLAEGGSKAFTDMSTAVNKQGAAMDLAAAQNSGFNGALDNLKSTVETAFIDIGTKLLPSLTTSLKSLADQVGRVADWFAQLSPAQQDMIFKTIAWTAALGPAVIVTGKAVKTVGTMVTAVTAVSKALGLFSTAKLVGEAGAATKALGAAGLSGAAANVAGTAGRLLPMLGPWGVALGGVAIAAGVAYFAYKKFSDAGKENAQVIDQHLTPETKEYWKLADQLGVTLQGTAKDTSFLGLAQQRVANDTAMVNAATAQHNELLKKQAASQVVLKQKSDDVATAQKGVDDALKNFGQNSPQYEDAVYQLQLKQDDYNLKLSDTINLSLQVSNKADQLKEAQKNLQQGTVDLANTQDYLNGKYSAGIATISTMGPTAMAQVESIHVLQGAIDGINISWSKAVNDINIQGPALAGVIQPVSIAISNVQRQSDMLNSTLRSANSTAISLQGSVGSIQGGTLQGHALGTQFSTGDLTLVGERGPELVQLPTGSKVTPAGETSQMLSRSTRTVMNNTFNVYNKVDMTGAIREIGWRLANA